MDFSTLIAPILSLASKLKTSCGHGIYNHKGRPISALAALDRTLGTAATLGVTLFLFRVLKQLRDEYKDKNDDGNSQNGRIVSSIQSLIQALVRGVMMGFGVRRIKPNSSSTDVKSPLSNKCEIRTFSGSCHCRSISFILRAPSHIEARDCDGKIRYPHCLSSANDFQLISGRKFLSVYYVDLCNDDVSDIYQHQFEHHVIAAHTFCNRCGVHILRAPNSHSNKLEINTNCLDDFKGVKDHKNSFVSINVTYEQRKDWMSMGQGSPIQDNQKKHAHEEKICDDEFSSLSIKNNTEHIISPWHAHAAYNKEFDSSMKWKHSEITPVTTSTPVSGSIISMATSDTESSSDGMSCDENVAAYTRTPLNVDISRSDSFSISGWPVASSLQSLTPRSSDTTRTNTSSGSKVKLRPSSTMKDQVKYYMRKHIASPSRLQHREDMASNDTLR